MDLHGDDGEEAPLLAGAQAAKQSGSKQSASSSYTADDDIAGPVVTGRHCARLGCCTYFNASHQCFMAACMKTSANQILGGH